MYQGRLFSSDGTAPLLEVVNLVASIVDPSGNCLLYQENFPNLDLGPSNGAFSISIGTAPGASTRTPSDPGLSMETVFGNKGTSIRSPGSLCTTGYTPNSGDLRKLRITITSQSSGIPVTLSPDQSINSQPTAVVAQSIQGLGLSDLIQSAAGVAGQGNVSLSTLASLTSSSDASVLHHHDSLYVKLGSGLTPTLLGGGIVSVSGQLGIGTSVPGAQVQINTSGQGAKGQIIRGSSAQSANLLEFQNTDGNILSFFDANGNLILGSDAVSSMGAASKQYVDGKFLGGVTSFNSRAGAIALQALDVTGALGFSPLNRSGDSGVGTLLLAPGKALGLGVYDSGSEAGLIASLGSMDVGKTWYSAPAKQVKYWDGTAVQTLALTNSYLTSLTGDISATGPGSASATVNSVGGVPASNISAGANAANSATDGNTAYKIVKRDGSGNFSAGTVIAKLVGNVTGAASLNVLKSGDSLSGALLLFSNPTVNSVGGVNASSIATGVNAANAATSANDGNSLIRRNPQGNFSAGTITAEVVGNITGLPLRTFSEPEIP